MKFLGRDFDLKKRLKVLIRRQALLICNHISDGIDLDLFVFALVHKFRLGSSTKASFSLGNNFPIIILTDDFCAWLSICYP